MTEIDTASRAYEDLDRDVYDYRPPETFPTPTSHPERHHRWLALEVMGQPNNHIMHKRVQEGYRFCTFEDGYPELIHLAPGGRVEGPIRYGNHVLGHNDPRRVKSRREFFERKSLGAAAQARQQAQSETGVQALEVERYDGQTGARRVPFGFDDP